MDILVVIGWWNESAIEAARSLGLLTTEITAETLDTLRDNIREINDEYSIKMRWVTRKSNTDDDHILVWQDVLAHRYKTLDDDPIANFVVAPSAIKKTIRDFKKFIESAGLECDEPSIFILTDISDLIIPDSDSD